MLQLSMLCLSKWNPYSQRKLNKQYSGLLIWYIRYFMINIIFICAPMFKCSERAAEFKALKFLNFQEIILKWESASRMLQLSMLCLLKWNPYCQRKLNKQYYRLSYQTFFNDFLFSHQFSNAAAEFKEFNFSDFQEIILKWESTCKMLQLAIFIFYECLLNYGTSECGLKFLF